LLAKREWTMSPIKLFAVSAIALAAVSGLAFAQSPPEGRLYVFHSTAQGGCPALDWHVVAGPNGALSGMIAWDDMKAMAKASGTATAGKVQMTATEVGGQNRTANISGTIRSDGWFIVNIAGPNVNCQNITVPFYVAPPGGG